MNVVASAQPSESVSGEFLVVAIEQQELGRFGAERQRHKLKQFKIRLVLSDILTKGKGNKGISGEFFVVAIEQQELGRFGAERQRHKLKHFRLG